MIAREIPRAQTLRTPLVTRQSTRRPVFRINEDRYGRTLGDRLQHAREAAGLTQLQLAERTGLTPSCVRMLEWEYVKWGGRADTIAALASALGVTMDWLFTGKEAGA